jgi:uncharacterized ferredoxin-like protein
MIIKSQEAELAAVLNAANAMCAAARTAPKACAIDHIDTAVLTGEDKTKVSAQMRRIGETINDNVLKTSKAIGKDGGFFIRDADNVDAAQAVVLIGAKYETRGLGAMCALCGFKDCAASVKAGAACAFTAMDLGIALGSAVSIAADLRIDNRIMFTIGKAAAALGLLGEYKMIIGIPLSVSGKTPFFDRKKI